MIDNYGNQVIPGSIDNGATDVEYTPRSERIICAADERHADHEKRIAAIERAVAHLTDMADALLEKETHPPELSAAANFPPVDSEPIGDFRRARGAVPFEPGDEPAEVIIRRLRDGIATQPEADYAHIPAAEWEAITEELEQLRAFKASVPWKSVKTCVLHTPNDTPMLQAARTTILGWLYGNAPQEANK